MGTNSTAYNLPRESEAGDLFSTYIAYCVFNSFLSFTAIMLNIVTIHAIRKTSSLPKTFKLKTLLLSLVVSGLGVGFSVQPFYSAFPIKCLQGKNPGCNISKEFHIIRYLSSTASFLSVMVLTVDRFLAIHLRYQEIWVA